MKPFLSRLLPYNWNDVLSIVILVGIPILWVSAGRGWIDLDRLGDLNGALIAMWTLVVQFYFRKGPPENGNPKPPGA